VTTFTILLSDYLLAAVAVSFSAGIGLSGLWATPLSLLYPLTAVTFPVLLAFYLLGRRIAALLSLLILFLFLGMLYGHQSSLFPEEASHVYNLVEEKREVVAIGTLLSMTTFDGENSQARIALHSFRSADDPLFRSVDGTVLVRLRGQWPADILPGARLAMRVSLQRPFGYSTPGSFDYPTHLARQDIWVSGTISTPLHLYRLEQQATLLHRLRFVPENLRHNLGVAIDRSVPPPLQGIYRALLIGDQSQVDDNTRRLFRDSGCMHILSISGLHFAIIATLLFFILFWLLRRWPWIVLRFNVRKIAMLLCLPPLCFYALLAGMNTPVLRSLIMSCTAILALCTDRRKSICTLLALAALIILLANPQALFTVSFQLSFAAVAAITLISPELRAISVSRDEKGRETSYYLRLRRWAMAALLVSGVASLGTAPLLLSHFNQVSLVAPLTNLVVEPLICLWSLPLALLACLALPVSPDLSALLLEIGGPGLKISLKVMDISTALSFSTVWLPTPKPWLIAAFYASMGLLVLNLRRKKSVHVGLSMLFAGTVLLFVFPPSELTKKLKKDLTVTFLDVGQGSATLLEFAGGYRLLIDGGGSSFSARTVGETVIAPFLWQKGITSLDQIIVTHPDADHYNGIPFLVRHFSPTLLWTNTRSGHDRFYQDFLAEAELEGVHVFVPGAGEQVGRPDIGAVTCLSNLAEESGRKGRTREDAGNDSGLVLQAKMGDFSILFPGDISQSGERQFIGKADPASTMLLSPHHGSKSSNSQAFLSAVHPRIMLVSAGQGRSMHFPHPGLESQCSSQGITMLTTARSGTITAVTDGRLLRVSGYKRTGTGLGGQGKREKLLAEITAIAENLPLPPSPAVTPR
jgi:competence protein ComEC